MATTAFGTGNNLTRKAWNARLIEETVDEIYFDMFMGEGPNNVIQVYRDLQRDKGDEITYGLVNILSDAGVTGDTTLKGNEEALTFGDDTVTLDQHRHAVILDGKLTEQRVNFNLREHARSRLAMWLAETIDDLIFDGFEASPTLSVFPGTATSTATLTAGDLLDPATISRAKATALKATPRIRPIRRGGQDYFLMVIHTDSAFDLKRDSEWGQNQREASIRGDDNPIWTGALGMHDGVIVHTHNRVGISTTFGTPATVPGATNSFMGMQAGVFAWGRAPEMVETEEDYGNRYAAAAGSIFGFNKSVFSAADYGYIQVPTARTNI